MKFGTRIEFCKIQETNHLIDKKDGGLKLNFDLNFQSATYVTSIIFLSIKPSLTKIMQLNSDLVSKWPNCAKNKLRIKLKFFKNCTIVIHSKIRWGEQ
jgi:hypothetical protein